MSITQDKVKKPADKNTRIRIYKVIAVIIILVFAFNAKLYSNVPQIDMRVIVTMLGVDKTDDGIRVSANILVPVSAADTKMKQEKLEAYGKTISLALDGLNIVSGRKVELSQCGMVVFGQRICEDGILPEVKHIFSTGVMGAGVILIAADKMEASDFINMTNEMSDDSSTGISSFLSFFENSFYLPSQTMLKFLSSSINESRAGFIPCIELVQKEESGSGSAGTGGGQSGAEGGKVVSIDNIGTVIAFKDGIRAARLTQDESRGLMWSIPSSRRGFIFLENFKLGETEYGGIGAEIKSKTSRMKYSFKDGKPHVSITVKASLLISDKHKFSYDLDKGIKKEPQLYKALSDALEDKIRSQIDAAVTECKNYDVDIFNFKYKFYRYKNKQIRAYERNTENDFLQDLEVDCDIKLRIT